MSSVGVLPNRIGSGAQPATGSETVEVRDPATDEVLGRVPLSGAAEVAAAVVAAGAPLAPLKGTVGGMSCPPHPLQWLELDGDGVAHIAIDDALHLIHWSRLQARGAKRLPQDSFSIGRGPFDFGRTGLLR